jgi:putative holliday junction resolvase
MTASQKPPRTPDLTIADFAALLPRGARLIGIDLGDKTVGLALSDVERRFASADRTLERRKFAQDWAEIEKLVRREGVGGFVMGLPLNMDGSSGPRVQASRTYARNIRNISPLPLLFWDERLSTFAAERALIEADVSRKKRAAVIDATAAAFILQGALDAMAAQ